MMRSSVILTGFASSLVIGVLGVGCGDSSGSGSGGGASTTSGSGKTTSTTTATGATSATGATTTTTSGTASTTASTGSGGPSMADHLLISEVSVTPDGAEFVEIWNPTAAPVALDDYYLSDNSTYVDLASGMPWMPVTNNPGTDFLSRFPAGTMIPADGVRVIGFDPGYPTAFGGACPDFYMGTAALTCGATQVPTMVATEAGSITDMSNLSNAREMLVLFTWDGNTAHTLKDVDYVTWGTMFEAGSRADKTAVSGYAPDTAAANQLPAAAPVLNQFIERCLYEPGEKLTGGNGITGHDETSENLGQAFVVQAAPTPGVKNACL